MKLFRLTRRAKSDLKGIANFTEKRWGKTQRNFYIKQFDDAFHVLADTPTLGKTCDYIKSGYQKFPQGSHIIFYKVISSQEITIIRILHKNMDVESNLNE